MVGFRELVRLPEEGRDPNSWLQSFLSFDPFTLWASFYCFRHYSRYSEYRKQQWTEFAWTLFFQSLQQSTMWMCLKILLYKLFPYYYKTGMVQLFCLQLSMEQAIVTWLFNSIICVKACCKQLFCAPDLASQWLGPRSVAMESFVTGPNRVRIKIFLGFSLNCYCFQISVMALPLQSWIFKNMGVLVETGRKQMWDWF